jgi:GTP pyrophosphokinase
VPGDEAKLTRMLLAMADVRVVLIVLAARLHQLRGLAGRRPGGSPGSALADETLHVFAPLANRLGVWSLKAEMEDLCFQVSPSA